MTPTKLLIGQILVVLAIMMLSIWTATQWAAVRLAYQPELGAPWFILLGTPIYHPWSIFPWWFSFDAYAPVIFDEAGAIAATGGFMGCAAAIVGSVWRARQPSNVTTYGSARWATRRDIQAAKLLGRHGVTLGSVDGDDLRHEGPEHVMVFAPTRSGKGVGLVVPTLLSWTGSTIVHDIKGENWQLTAGWRSRFSHCLLFNPTDARSARYNPLLEVRRGVNEVRDVQNIADILVDPEGALERRNHWEKTSHSLLVGAILHVLYAEEEKTLARVATFLSDPQRSFVATLRRMMATNHLGTADSPKVHPVVASAARELLNKSENERSGVLSTAMSFLGLYRDPTVAAVTAASDWRISDLVKAPHPVSLYLVVPPSDISRTKPLVRLVLNQIHILLSAIILAAPQADAKTFATSLRGVASANRKATAEPAAQGFINAIQVYPFADGAIFQVYAAPGSVTDIALQPGETLVAVASGDTTRWVIGDTTSGVDGSDDGEAKRTHILVKPFSAGLTTNLVITTNRRTYHLRLASTAATAMAGISWTYPQDDLIALNRQAEAARAAAPVASGLDIARLNFDYAISGDRPSWRPLRAFDDGRQTYIEFPPALAQGDAPPLFLLGPDGKAELVNYRLRDRYYVVDRLFGTAELRLGLKKQEIVRITRLAGQKRRRGA